jgi:hypothetical protein
MDNRREPLRPALAFKFAVKFVELRRERFEESLNPDHGTASPFLAV